MKVYDEKETVPSSLKYWPNVIFCHDVLFFRAKVTVSFFFILLLQIVVNKNYHLTWTQSAWKIIRMPLLKHLKWIEKNHAHILINNEHTLGSVLFFFFSSRNSPNVKFTWIWWKFLVMATNYLWMMSESKSNEIFDRKLVKSWAFLSTFEYEQHLNISQ